MLKAALSHRFVPSGWRVTSYTWACPGIPLQLRSSGNSCRRHHCRCCCPGWGQYHNLNPECQGLGSLSQVPDQLLKSCPQPQVGAWMWVTPPPHQSVDVHDHMMLVAKWKLAAVSCVDVCFTEFQSFYCCSEPRILFTVCMQSYQWVNACVKNILFLIWCSVFEII